MKMAYCTSCLAVVFVGLAARVLQAENRSIDGTGNHPKVADLGAANRPMIRFGYRSEFLNDDGAMITDQERAGARDLSNTIFAQSASRPSARNLSDYIWAWGQFVSHDTDLTTTSNGPDNNGTAPIAVNDPLDPLGPNPIPFTRSNYVDVEPIGRSSGGRTPVNEVTSFIDASNVYGSNPVRAAALRTDGGSGAKLLTSANNLLPYNTAGLPIENNGPLPDNQMFLAGDIRSNENALLASLHTIFVREHNRLVDVIAGQQPDLNAEQQYQLARKIVGAEMQIVTYREFLPALLGTGPAVPKAADYHYHSEIDPSITTAFAHAAFRFGHSTVSSQLQLVDDNGANAGSIAVRNAFYNPALLGDAPETLDQLLKGAAVQTSEEVDTLIVDELRNFLFGPSGAGGLDLAAINIQRGRDVGMPDYQRLAARRQIGVHNFSQITSDAELANALSAVYGNNLANIDAWVGMLAEDHVLGASAGRLLKVEIEGQFERLRDGDRLFYLSPDAGLYADGTLNAEIAAIIDLDRLRLADIILANSGISNIQRNVFFVPSTGDFNGDGIVNSIDYTVWRDSLGATGEGIAADADHNGTVGSEDYQLWSLTFGSDYRSLATSTVPEPSSVVLVLLSILISVGSARRQVGPFAKTSHPACNRPSALALLLRVAQSIAGLIVVQRSCGLRRPLYGASVVA